MSLRTEMLDSRLVLGLAVALALAGCSKKEEAAPSPEAAAPAATALEGQVDIVAWPGYIERGETRGQILIAADTDGRGIGIDNPGLGLPGTDTHFKECGHILQSKLAGTDVLALCAIHFN